MWYIQVYLGTVCMHLVNSPCAFFRRKNSAQVRYMLVRSAIFCNGLCVHPKRSLPVVETENPPRFLLSLFAWTLPISLPPPRLFFRNFGVALKTLLFYTKLNLHLNANHMWYNRAFWLVLCCKCFFFLPSTNYILPDSIDDWNLQFATNKIYTITPQNCLSQKLCNKIYWAKLISVKSNKSQHFFVVSGRLGLTKQLVKFFSLYFFVFNNSLLLM